MARMTEEEADALDVEITNADITLKPGEGGIFSEKQKKLTAFRKLTNEIVELNKTDPLPLEFDEILSQRMHFRRN
jgi:hypothetical protein